MEGVFHFDATTKPGRNLRPVFQKWALLNDQYLARVPKDLAYWYLEGSHRGLLSAATWQCRGAAALEEWGIKRRRERRKRLPGRADLYIRYRRTEYVGELKCRWLRFRAGTISNGFCSGWRRWSRRASVTLRTRSTSTRRMRRGGRGGSLVSSSCPSLKSATVARGVSPTLLRSSVLCPMCPRGRLAATSLHGMKRTRTAFGPCIASTRTATVRKIEASILA